MVRMRRLLELREWTPTLLELSPEELVELRAVPADLTIEPQATPGHFSVVPASVVGAISTQHMDVLIAPKLDIERVLYLLGYSSFSGALPPTGLRPERTLVEAFASMFIGALAPPLRRGPLRRYRTYDDALPAVRGRVRFADQARRRFGLPLPVEVRLDEHTVDVEENRLLKAALRRLEQMRLRSRSLRARVAEALTALDGVTDRRYDGASVPRFHLTRLDERFRTPLELARVIVANSSLELRPGAQRVAGLLFNMNRVFEDFVFAAVGEALRRRAGSALSWRQGASLHLDEASRISLRPDLTLWAGARCRFIGDVKYKRTAEGENPDLYQVLAYCRALGLGSATLIYGDGPDAPVAHTVRHGGPVLNVRRMCLDASIADLERQSLGLAEAILAEVGHPSERSLPLAG